MDHKDFTYWLKGFIEGKLILTQSDIETIKAKTNEIVGGYNGITFLNTGNSNVTKGYPTGTTFTKN
jgi:hypothetical protein